MNKFKRARLRMHMEVPQWAKRIQASKSAVYNWENGDVIPHHLFVDNMVKALEQSGLDASFLKRGRK